LNTSVLTKNLSRIEMKCTVKNRLLTLWVDTGSPNTLVSASFLKRFGLSPVGTTRYSGNVGGVQFTQKPSVLIPEIKLNDGLAFKNVRALAVFNDDYWNSVILLGLNVLNHLTYKIDRVNSTFEWLESLTPLIPTATRTKFNHIIMNGKYLLSDTEE